MEITLEQLLKGKATRINGKDFLSTSDFVTPFLEKTKKLTNTFRIEAIPPKQITTTENKEDITYNRVLLYAILNNKVDTFNEVILLTYALDVRIPIVKISRGYFDNTTGIFMCPSHTWLVVKELKPLEAIDVGCIDVLLSLPDNFQLVYNKFTTTILSTKETNRYYRLGMFIEKCHFLCWKNDIGSNVKLSPASMIKAYENMYINHNSNFYVGDKDSTALNMYKAIASMVAEDHKDISNKVEKTLLINMLFGA